MDLKPIVGKIAADCDLRNRFVRNVPGLMDQFFLSGKGEILTKKEADKAYAINYFLDGLDFVASRISRS